MNDGRFGGDMDRNEVEMDLNKFMAMIQEISELKDKIRELEDTKNVNPHQKWIHLAQAVDSWRIFPRLFLTVYISYTYHLFLAPPCIATSSLATLSFGLHTKPLPVMHAEVGNMWQYT